MSAAGSVVRRNPGVSETNTTAFNLRCGSMAVFLWFFLWICFFFLNFLIAKLCMALLLIINSEQKLAEDFYFKYSGGFSLLGVFCYQGDEVCSDPEIMELHCLPVDKSKTQQETIIDMRHRWLLLWSFVQGQISHSVYSCWKTSYKY